MSGEGEKINRRRQCARGSSIESTSHKVVVESAWYCVWGWFVSLIPSWVELRSDVGNEKAGALARRRRGMTDASRVLR